MKANQNLDIVQNCCLTNNLTLNTDKTNYIVIKNSQSKATITKSIYIKYIIISKADNIKLLGVLIDPILNLRLELGQNFVLIYVAFSFQHQFN